MYFSFFIIFEDNSNNWRQILVLLTSIFLLKYLFGFIVIWFIQGLMNKDAENSFYLYVTMANNQETGVISKKNNINIVQIHKKFEFLLGTQLANDIYIYVYIKIFYLRAMNIIS